MKPSSSSVNVLDEEHSWPAVVVWPCQNQTGNRQTDFWAMGFASELTIKLARYLDIRVVLAVN